MHQKLVNLFSGLHHATLTIHRYPPSHIRRTAAFIDTCQTLGRAPTAAVGARHTRKAKQVNGASIRHEANVDPVYKMHTYTHTRTHSHTTTQHTHAHTHYTHIHKCTHIRTHTHTRITTHNLYILRRAIQVLPFGAIAGSTGGKNSQEGHGNIDDDDVIRPPVVDTQHRRHVASTKRRSRRLPVAMGTDFADARGRPRTVGARAHVQPDVTSTPPAATRTLRRPRNLVQCSMGSQCDAVEATYGFNAQECLENAHRQSLVAFEDVHVYTV